MHFRLLCFLSASRWFLSWLILWPWRWKRHVPLKRQLTFSGLHGVIAQKLEFSITTAVTTSNLTCENLIIYAHKRNGTTFNLRKMRWAGHVECIGKGKVIPIQAVEALKVERRGSSQIFRYSAHRWRRGCQPYAPAAFYPQEDPWYSF
jgi:hypothetical protein